MKLPEFEAPLQNDLSDEENSVSEIQSCYNTDQFSTSGQNMTLLPAGEVVFHEVSLDQNLHLTDEADPVTSFHSDLSGTADIPVETDVTGNENKSFVSVGTFLTDFEQAYATLRPQSISYLMRQFNFTYDDAVQLSQDSFERALTRFDRSTAGDRNFSTWFFTVVNHLAIDAIRKTKRRGVHISLSNENNEIEEHIHPASDSVENDTLTSLRDEALRQALDELGQESPEQKEILEMNFIQGKSISQIAEILGLPTGTLKTRSRLGKIKLRKLLKKYPDLQ